MPRWRQTFMKRAHLARILSRMVISGKTQPVVDNGIPGLRDLGFVCDDQRTRQEQAFPLPLELHMIGVG